MSQQKRQKAFYPAVSIHPDVMGACIAATEMAGKRFLASEAPHLPLTDCSNPSRCRCKYQHWDDRRQDDRRSTYCGIGEDYLSADDRRTGKDRRSR